MRTCRSAIHAFDANDLRQGEHYYNLILAATNQPCARPGPLQTGRVRVNRQDCKGAVRLFELVFARSGQAGQERRDLGIPPEESECRARGP